MSAGDSAFRFLGSKTDPILHVSYPSPWNVVADFAARRGENRENRNWRSGRYSKRTALSLLLAGSLAAETVMARTIRRGVVLPPEVVARKGDSDTYEQRFKAPLHSGTEFRLVEARGPWYHIQLTDGQRCWIPKKSSALVRPETKQGE